MLCYIGFNIDLLYYISYFSVLCSEFLTHRHHEFVEKLEDSEYKIRLKCHFSTGKIDSIRIEIYTWQLQDSLLFLVILIGND